METTIVTEFGLNVSPSFVKRVTEDVFHQKDAKTQLKDFTSAIQKNTEKSIQQKEEIKTLTERIYNCPTGFAIIMTGAMHYIMTWLSTDTVALSELLKKYPDTTYQYKVGKIAKDFENADLAHKCANDLLTDILTTYKSVVPVLHGKRGLLSSTGCIQLLTSYLVWISNSEAVIEELRVNTTAITQRCLKFEKERAAIRAIRTSEKNELREAAVPELPKPKIEVPEQPKLVKKRTARRR